MTALEDLIVDQPLRAPIAHGEFLQLPPLSDAVALIAANRQALNQAASSRLGGSLESIRARAQAELVEQAVAYTRQYVGDVQEPADSSLLALAGHQPELFHGGVWYKNFVLDSIGKRTGGACVNLLIDNDVCGIPAIRVPQAGGKRGRVATVAIDQTLSPTPWENRHVADPQLFASFSDRVIDALGCATWHPIMPELWAHACDPDLGVVKLGERIAAARHRVEREAGLETLELPLSHVCQTESFCQFAAVLIGEHKQFLQLYNDSLFAYRRVHRIRSRTHPVPELRQDEQWWEAPFWIWSADEPQRRALFVTRRGADIYLSDRKAIETKLSCTDLAAGLFDLRNAGIALRPRALITTMYGRLLLSSLFLHGIGGAKYDQLTDVIIRRFFEIAPPDFMVNTATLKLPFSYPNVEPQDVTAAHTRLRSLRYHPELSLDDGVDARLVGLIAEKRRLLAAIPPRDVSRKQWHDRICQVNAALQPYVTTHREIQVEELDRLEDQLAQKRLLGSREFSFGLFPAGETQTLLKTMAEQ